MQKIIRYICNLPKKIFTNVKEFFASDKKEILSNKKVRKSFYIILMIIFMLSESFAWLYDEYSGQGALLTTGVISHEVIQYDAFGLVLEEDNEVQTLFYETNMSNITVGTKYIEVRNTGTLDMEYSLAFSLEGTTDVAGVMYYRIYEVTSAIDNTSLGSYGTKLEAYANANQPTSAMEYDVGNPITNMTLMNNLMKIDSLEAPVGGDTSSKIYRIDYGMYQAVNTSLYSGESISIHLNAYSSQLGVISAENREGQIWEVQNETQLREILNSAIAGDTIKLLDNISINGSLNITKRINLDLNGFTMNVAQDLIYEFFNVGNVLIDTSGYGNLVIGEDFYLNTPSAEVTLEGSNNSYDIAVGGTFTINAIQDGEADGLYLDNVRIVKTINGLVPVDLLVMSNTRVTLGTDVVIGNITALEGTTNIEIVNNGFITQLDFTAMSLLETYTKAQIYVYNLGEIYGILGSYGILLPETATPYIGPNNGNTLIVKGITSGDITVGGSENFDLTDVQTNQSDISVVPIEDEDNSYIVYIKSSLDSVEGLLEDYFEEQQSQNAAQDISNIKKMIVWTLNAQFFEPEDFAFVKSNAMSSLEYLSLHNSRVTDGTTHNVIPDNAFENKTSLKTVILPRAVQIIGDNAFSGVNLGSIPASITDEFAFLTIPSTVDTIGTGAFDSTDYIKFMDNIPPTIGTNAFSNTTKIFVPNGAIEIYQEEENILSEHVYITANLSDDRRYFVFETATGLGISYVVNNYISGSSLGIPDSITYLGSSMQVTEIGTNSYRELIIVNEEGIPAYLPNTVTRINDYAFHSLPITSMSFTNTSYIGDYAFYETKVSSLLANALTYVGNYAFYNTSLETVQLNNVITIMNYAFANDANLYEANVGTASFIGNYAFYNCRHMQRFHFNNGNSVQVNNTEEIDLEVGTNAIFSNWGYYIDGRLRVYVPDMTLPSGNTVLSLYKNKFSDNANYIYINGTDTGSYTHLAVPYDLTEYTVREVTLRNYNNVSVTGYEIISYQGKDLNANIPSYLTVNGVGKNVISVGEGAYQNVNVNTTNPVGIENTRLLNIGPYAFKGLTLDHIIADSVTDIGTSAFEGSGIHYGFFQYLTDLGSRAFYNCEGLYRLKIGKVLNIGSEAMANTPNLTSVFIDNILRNVDYAPDALNDTGTNIANRFRMYVPDQDNLVSFYSGLYPNLSDYIYPMGTIVGHFRYGSINYDIGEYSVREVTKQNALGVDVTDYEIIEYHGADLSSNYVLPLTLTPASDSIELNYTISRAGTWDISVNVTMVNTGDQEITAWQVDVLKDGGMYGLTGAGVTAVDNGQYITFRNGNAGEGKIRPGATKTQAFHIKSTTNPISEVTISAIRATVPGAQTYNVISIGDNAYSHATTVSNASFDISSNNVLFVGKNAFANIDGIKHVTLNNVVTIDNYAFDNTSTTVVSLNNVNTLGTGVFRNNVNLYKINFGKAQKLGASTITNATYLYQVIFDVPETIGLDIHASVFANIGTATNDRMRFYVKNGITGTNERYVDVYKSHFPTAYHEYFYSYDNIVGSYTPPGITEEIDIGDFSVINKTVNGVVGYELVEYHGATIDANYEFPTLLNVNDRNLSATIEILGDSWAINGGYATDLKLYITNNGNSNVESWKAIVNFPNSGSLLSVSTYDNGADVSGLTAILTSSRYMTPISPGETYELQLQVSHSLSVINPVVTSIRINNITTDHLPVLSIGDYAFKHAIFDGTAAFNINSSYLNNIGEAAFQNNTGIVNINASNLKTIGNHAFDGATSLKTASFPTLTYMGDYTFNNCSNLVIVDIGQTTNIGVSAFANTTKVARLTIRKMNYNNGLGINVNSTAFNNFGTAIGNRLRIYVPDADISSSLNYVGAYKELLSNYSSYIYEIGEVIGTYNYEALNIGEYSVKRVTVNSTEGWQIIEYHGANVNEDFDIPTSVTAGDTTLNVISIGTRAYDLTDIEANYSWNLVLPSTVINVEDYAFYQGPMSTISGGSIYNIGSYAFGQSPNLRTVAFDSVITIEDHAFYLCPVLSQVNLGTGTLSIGEYAFYNTYANSNLRTMYVNTSVPPTITSTSLPGVYTFFTFVISKLTVRVPNNSIDEYSDHNYWGRHNIGRLGETCGNFICELTSRNEIKILEYTGGSDEVVIPDQLTLNRVSYPVTQISPEAFDGSSAVEIIEFGRNVKNIGNGFLSGSSSNVEEFRVNDNNPYFEVVDGVLFSEDLSTLIRYPRGKTSSLYEVADGTKIIASGAFLKATYLNTITFNEDLLAISETAFTGAAGLNTINFASAIPPYLMGFEFLPLNGNIEINFPLDNGIDRYSSQVYYSWYSSYLFGS